MSSETESDSMVSPPSSPDSSTHNVTALPSSPIIQPSRHEDTSQMMKREPQWDSRMPPKEDPSSVIDASDSRMSVDNDQSSTPPLTSDVPMSHSASSSGISEESPSPPAQLISQSTPNQITDSTSDTTSMMSTRRRSKKDESHSLGSSTGSSRVSSPARKSHSSSKWSRHNIPKLSEARVMDLISIIDPSNDEKTNLQTKEDALTQLKFFLVYSPESNEFSSETRLRLLRSLLDNSTLVRCKHATLRKLMASLVESLLGSLRSWSVLNHNLGGGRSHRDRSSKHSASESSVYGGTTAGVRLNSAETQELIRIIFGSFVNLLTFASKLSDETEALVLCKSLAFGFAEKYLSLLQVINDRYYMDCLRPVCEEMSLEQIRKRGGRPRKGGSNDNNHNSNSSLNSTNGILNNNSSSGITGVGADNGFAEQKWQKVLDFLKQLLKIFTVTFVGSANMELRVISHKFTMRVTADTASFRVGASNSMIRWMAEKVASEVQLQCGDKDDSTLGLIRGGSSSDSSMHSLVKSIQREIKQRASHLIHPVLKSEELVRLSKKWVRGLAERLSALAKIKPGSHSSSSSSHGSGSSVMMVTSVRQTTDEITVLVRKIVSLIEKRAQFRTELVNALSSFVHKYVARQYRLKDGHLRHVSVSSSSSKMIGNSGGNTEEGMAEEIRSLLVHSFEKIVCRLDCQTFYKVCESSLKQLVFEQQEWDELRARVKQARTKAKEAMALRDTNAASVKHENNDNMAISSDPSGMISSQLDEESMQLQKQMELEKMELERRKEEVRLLLRLPNEYLARLAIECTKKFTLDEDGMMHEDNTSSRRHRTKHVTEFDTLLQLDKIIEEEAKLFQKLLSNSTGSGSSGKTGAAGSSNGQSGASGSGGSGNGSSAASSAANGISEFLLTEAPPPLRAVKLKRPQQLSLLHTCGDRLVSAHRLGLLTLQGKRSMHCLVVSRLLSEDWLFSDLKQYIERHLCKSRESMNDFMPMILQLLYNLYVRSLIIDKKSKQKRKEMMMIMKKEEKEQQSQKMEVLVKQEGQTGVVNEEDNDGDVSMTEHSEHKEEESESERQEREKRKKYHTMRYEQTVKVVFDCVFNFDTGGTCELLIQELSSADSSTLCNWRKRVRVSKEAQSRVRGQSDDKYHLLWRLLKNSPHLTKYCLRLLVEYAKTDGLMTEGLDIIGKLMFQRPSYAESLLNELLNLVCTSRRVLSQRVCRQIKNKLWGVIPVGFNGLVTSSSSGSSGSSPSASQRGPFDKKILSFAIQNFELLTYLEIDRDFMDDSGQVRVPQWTPFNHPRFPKPENSTSKKSIKQSDSDNVSSSEVSSESNPRLTSESSPSERGSTSSTTTTTTVKKEPSRESSEGDDGSQSSTPSMMLIDGNEKSTKKKKEIELIKRNTIEEVRIIEETLQSDSKKALELRECCHRHCELFTVLCTIPVIGNSLFLQCFVPIYTQIKHKLIRDAVNSQFNELINHWGMSKAHGSPLLTLVEQCRPQTVEEFVQHLIEHSIREYGMDKIPLDLVQAVHVAVRGPNKCSVRLYLHLLHRLQRRQLLHDFLPDLIVELTKTEFCQAFGKLFDLMAEENKKSLMIGGAVGGVSSASSASSAGVSAAAAPGSATVIPRFTPTELVLEMQKLAPRVDSPLIHKVLELSVYFLAQGKWFPVKELSYLLSRLVGLDPLPILFFRTFIDALNYYNQTLKPFAVHTLKRLVEKQVWLDPQLWEGFGRCISAALPESLEVAANLPQKELKLLLKNNPDLKQDMCDYVSKHRDRSHFRRYVFESLGLSLDRMDHDNDGDGDGHHHSSNGMKRERNGDDESSDHHIRRRHSSTNSRMNQRTMVKSERRRRESSGDGSRSIRRRGSSVSRSRSRGRNNRDGSRSSRMRSGMSERPKEHWFEFVLDEFDESLLTNQSDRISKEIFLIANFAHLLKLQTKGEDTATKDILKIDFIANVESEMRKNRTMELKTKIKQRNLAELQKEMTMAMSHSRVRGKCVLCRVYFNADTVPMYKLEQFEDYLNRYDFSKFGIHVCTHFFNIRSLYP